MAALDEGKKKWENDGVAVEDSNMAGVGSQEDKDARKAAAETEEAWVGCGAAEGLEIWRIEQFQVKSWPREEYGKFYAGDSYICLKTTKDPESDKLWHDIHFWLGESTSQDEQGTAAYKTVELDDLMDGEPTQHREVMGHESQAFQGFFSDIVYLEGGVESGFNHVEPDAYIPKLLQVRKSARTVKVVEVPLTTESMNEGDCYILDAGEKIYTYYGAESSAFERNKCGQSAENIENTRNGRSTACAIDRDAADGDPDSEAFWNLLGGKTTLKTAAEGDAYTVPEIGEGVLFRLSDESGTLLCSEVGRGDLTYDMLDTNDVFLVDTGAEILVWVGDGASATEKRQAMGTALKYLEQQGKPSHTPIHCFKEGKPIHNEVWVTIFGTAPSNAGGAADGAAAADGGAAEPAADDFVFSDKATETAINSSWTKKVEKVDSGFVIAYFNTSERAFRLTLDFAGSNNMAITNYYGADPESDLSASKAIPPGEKITLMLTAVDPSQAYGYQMTMAGESC